MWVLSRGNSYVEPLLRLGKGYSRNLDAVVAKNVFLLEVFYQNILFGKNLISLKLDAVVESF